MIICSRCKTAKPETEFARRARSANGRQTYCRACNTLAQREYNQRHPGSHHRVYPAQRRKILARCRVNMAIKRGKLPHATTHTCACGECQHDAAQYYYHDYGETIRISPICRECYGAIQYRNLAPTFTTTLTLPRSAWALARMGGRK